jgi:hypothetical protein
MKTTFLIFIAIVLLGCAKTEHKEPKEITESKIVKAKNQAEETTYDYKYNVWKGNFYHQPNIHSAYYIVYTDGSYDEVDLGKFSITDVGDTIRIKKFVW